MTRYHYERFKEDGIYRCVIVKRILQINKESVRNFVGNKVGSRIGFLKGDIGVGRIDEVEVFGGHDGELFKIEKPDVEGEEFVKFAKKLQQKGYVGFVEAHPERKLGFNWYEMLYVAKTSQAADRAIIHIDTNIVSAFDKIIPEKNIRAYLVKNDKEYRNEDDIIEIKERTNYVIKTFRHVQMFYKIRLF